MDITFISDTHGSHDLLKLEKGMVLIHAGDITEYGSEEEVKDFLGWFSKQPFTYKIFIAGNHDLFLQDCPALKRNKLVPGNVIYLQNSSVQVGGLNFWGSPVTPYFLGMAFNVETGKNIKKIWNKIPVDTDVIITHGPPKGIFDGGIGNEELLERVNILRPKIHAFGHAHGWHGVQAHNEITFVNAALADTPDPMKGNEYKFINRPVKLFLQPPIQI